MCGRRGYLPATMTPQCSVNLIRILGLALLLAACAPAGLSAEELRGTAELLAATQIVATQRALPTNTQQPPATLTPPPSPTETPLPTSTPLPSETATPTAEYPATNTPWVNPNNMASLRFQNNTDETIFAILSGRSYGEYSFSDSWNLTTPWGDYNYLVWIGNEGPYGSSFRITNRDKYTLVIDPGKVHMVGP